MNFILLQILLCLLLAGLIGAVIGWLLRGNCSKKLLARDEECEMKMRAIEREWNTKLNYSDDKEPDVYNNLLDAEAQAHADLKNTDDKFNLTTAQEILSQKGVHLSNEKIKLYTDNDIDFEKSEDLEDSYDIEVIEGINSKYAQRFKDMGINTTVDLVKKLGKNYDSIDNVAKKLKVQPEDILSWISMADIIHLPGINAKNAQLIQNVGITSSRELGAVNIHSLHREMASLNKKSPMMIETPDIDSLQFWSKIARLLE